MSEKVVAAMSDRGTVERERERERGEFADSFKVIV